MAVPPGDLLADTQVTRDLEHPGRYAACIPEAWQVVYAFGGVTMTTALRAMEEALGRPELRLVTANAIFCAPVPCGPVTIDVQVLRDGRRAAQLAADLRVAGTEEVALRAHGVFGTAHDTDLALQSVEFPAGVRPPEACEPPPPPPDDTPWPHINFHDQTEWLPAIGDADLGTDRAPGPARFAAWNRMLVEPRFHDGRYDLLSLAVQGDVLGPAVGRALGSRAGPFMVLSLEIGIRFLGPPAGSWVLQEVEAWHAGDGYATGPARLWDDEGNLLAIATQTAHLRRFPTT